MNQIPALPADFRPRRRDNLSWRQVGGQLFVVDAPASRLHRSNEAGALIWALCDGQHDRPAILAALSAEFEAGSAELGRDLDDFLRSLIQAGLVDPPADM